MNASLDPRRVCFVTLGCAKNEVDTDRMRAHIEADPRLTCTDDPNDAQLIVVNTCSFLVSAVEEGIETTLALVAERVDGQLACPVVMCGCIPARYGSEGLAAEMPEVAAFVPVAEEDGIAEVAARALGLEPLSDAGEPAVARTVQAAFAYVKISDGCDRFCSFCAIPYIRGRYYSRPLDQIMAEVRMLLEGGVRELVLIGQDTGIWGHDLPGAPTLAQLLRTVAEAARPYGAWVRVLYLQPEGLTDDLVAAIRDTPEVVKYIDIPLQHAAADVLARMNRTGSRAEFLAMVRRLRAEVPGITLRTTALVGFPGETEEEFEELCGFLEEAAFDYCAVFAYSQEEGTAAAEMDGQVPEDVKLEREQRVRDLADECGFASAAQRIGGTYRVLVDAVEDDGDGNVELVGRAAFQSPDSDGVVHLGDLDAAMGDFVEVRIDDAACYELFAVAD
jgi:ribosomal protein S12 methylthiotransferase